MSVENYETEFGTIHHSSTCKDDWDNLHTYDQPPEGGAVITLQRPAIRSFREAEERYARRRNWRPGRPRAQRRRNGTRFRPIYLTGSIRSCALQRQLYASDSSRYAHPDKTLHTQGLAIDVHTAYLNNDIKRILGIVGWHQSRPVDEPWHFSFRLTA